MFNYFVYEKRNKQLETEIQKFQNLKGISDKQKCKYALKKNLR